MEMSFAIIGAFVTEERANAHKQYLETKYPGKIFEVFYEPEYIEDLPWTLNED